MGAAVWRRSVCECNIVELRTLRSDRPDEQINLTGATGLTSAQVATRKALGAVEGVDSTLIEQ